MRSPLRSLVVVRREGGAHGAGSKVNHIVELTHPSTWAGLLALALAGLLIVLGPPTFAPVVLAGVATALLARDRALGPLGAGLAVILALPFGRGADVAVLTVAGLPMRPHDAAVTVAILLALPGLTWRGADHRGLAILGGFLAIGLLATGVGLLAGHPLRDVLRDVRWWGLYSALGLALLAHVRRDQIIRGLLLGSAALAGLILLAVLLPAFEAGLKSQVLEYDRGTLRMQFGNSLFLLPAIAWTVCRFLAQPSRVMGAWTGFLVVVLVASLTRTSILVLLGMLAVVALGWVVAERPGWIRMAQRGVALGIVVGLAVAGGVGAVTIGVVTAGPGAPSNSIGGEGESPLDRITFRSDDSDLGSIISAAGGGGRLGTYRNALERIGEAPILGLGMGSLVKVDFAYSTARTYTHGMQPGVDNAWLTVALKAGLVGAAAFFLLVIGVLLRALRRPHLRGWFIPAWLAFLALTMTQSTAVTSYAPFGIALLAAVPFLGYASRSGRTAADHV